MTIDKAIEIIKCWGEDDDEVDEGDFSEAVQLGVEALKEVARARRLGPPLSSFRLPGETEK